MAQLKIPAQLKRGGGRGPGTILAVVAGIIVLGLVVHTLTGRGEREPDAREAGSEGATAPSVTNAPPKSGDVVLTVSGYVSPRERIAISPKFQGTVRAIHVTKGDMVKRGDVLVELEDDEQRARLSEAQGDLAQAEAALTNAIVNFERQRMLADRNIDTAQAMDAARRDRDMADARVRAARGRIDLAQTYLAWCTIRAPIDGTIMEKLVNPNELVTPLSYGGGSGPSTAFLAMANLEDLQVEIDLSEGDTPKAHVQQRCRISPEAYPEKVYSGYVAEIAPEANRSKGTLQVKVQIENPDRFLTPELSAKVEFLAD
ncbi:MAG: efflux RND transporter periplasmic adaptor subunit [Verrucomicrobia bacterium]|nr:efflux RND transporter periplasmic adaptor subunit [Verrucomicrobiota bacterium]